MFLQEYWTLEKRTKTPVQETLLQKLHVSQLQFSEMLP